MEDRTCKNCRWWLPAEGRYPDRKVCRSPKMIDRDDMPRFDQGVTGDGFGLDYPVCDLVTGPDFGCVHFEGREHA